MRPEVALVARALEDVRRAVSHARANLGRDSIRNGPWPFYIGAMLDALDAGRSELNRHDVYRMAVQARAIIPASLYDDVEEWDKGDRRGTFKQPERETTADRAERRAAYVENDDVELVACGQLDCDELAIYTTTWPGGREALPACDEHRRAAVAIGERMGFQVPVEVLAQAGHVLALKEAAPGRIVYLSSETLGQMVADVLKAEGGT